MKKIFLALVIVSLVLSIGLMAHESDPYAFVTNFDLASVEMDETEAVITVLYSGYSEPRFELIPGQVCLESYPAQCYATIVRLDDSPVTQEELKEHTFRVDLAKVFAPEGVIVRIYGPKGVHMKVQY